MHTSLIKTSVFLFLFSVSCLLHAGTFTDENEEEVSRLVQLILNDHRDSVLMILQNSHRPKSEVLNQIADVVSGNNVALSSYVKFINLVSRLENPDIPELLRFLDTNIPLPESDSIDYDYVLIKWLQIDLIRNQLLDLSEASKRNQQLKDYLAQHTEESLNKTRSEILVGTHDVVMREIQGDIEKGLAMAKELEDQARVIGDTSLIIAALYHSTYFLVPLGKLEEFIEISEYCYDLDQMLEEKSYYYEGTIQHLLNAYIHKGDNTEKVIELLDEYYNIEPTTTKALALYAQFLFQEHVESAYTQKIYTQFGVNDPIELANEFVHLGEGSLDGISYFHLLQELARYLHKKKLYEESQQFYRQSIAQIRTTYSKDLSKTIAEYEKDLLVREKETELKAQTEKTQRSIWIAILVSILLILSVFSLYRQILTSKKLKDKRSEIQTQHDVIAKKEKEKELLLNELHHRVKNNFQIIINLLEMQAAKLSDNNSKQLVIESRNRVKSMAFVHGKLTTSNSMQVDFDKYTNDLMREIGNSFESDVPIEFLISVEGFQFNIDTAVPLGLIVNELVTNAYKYGFQVDKKILQLTIEEKANECYELTVADNGSGFSKDFNLDETNSLGLNLVKGFANQLGGGLEIRNDAMNKLVVTFKELQF